MSYQNYPEIVIKGARTNNLKNISLCLPHNKLIAVTGLSGSGKSSLAFEVIAKEGQRRYFETLPSFARQFLGKLNRPDVDEIEGLSPVIAIGQKSSGIHARSTVGTQTEIYDLLRLLYARTGESPNEITLSRSLFSFNSARGKCARCNGIGNEEQIDLNRLIIYPEKTIREGALAPTLPNGYIMYSQVTIDVLNQVCKAEGFHVDIPWKELTELQRQVILYGSNKIKVPFGKHSLESRLKWTGIKAKPREEGFYKGMIPIMSDILRRDRNSNILGYVQSVQCSDCKGKRLNNNALSVKIHDQSIADLTDLELNALVKWIDRNEWKEIGQKIVQKIRENIEVLQDLGLGHLTLSRSSKTLRTSEIQRIRVANQIMVPLSNVVYVFDEPSIGLHSQENKKMIHHFKDLVRKGNTVIVVEHDLETITHSDHILEIGPMAGINGGQVIFNGAVSEFLKKPELKKDSPTYRALCSSLNQKRKKLKTLKPSLILKGCYHQNLKKIDVEFKVGQLNIVSGRSGSGKSSLVKQTLLPLVEKYLRNKEISHLNLDGYLNIDTIDKLIFIDHSPIGKTPRSNPATYLGISDYLRDLYANLPESKSLGFTKSRFSFNNKGGRCEECQGAGKTQIGMHFLGKIDQICATCKGARFNNDTLSVKYNGRSISDIYSLSIDEAFEFFKVHGKIAHGLSILKDVGLGYLTLGQSSTTLSGGEAQRIKIANQLQKKDTGNTLYVIVDPCIGLHQADMDSLLNLFDRIKMNGNTIVCIEQDENFIQGCDWHIELGPGSGSEGGEVEYQGPPKAHVIKQSLIEKAELSIGTNKNEILLQGVTTKGLKNIDIKIPKNKLTVVTGVSGSGKSSLVYDTLFAESNARFTESLSTYNRTFIQQKSEARIASYSGLGPSIGIHRKKGNLSNRSTVGTLSGIYEAFRLLYSRVAQARGENYSAQHFSFNHHLGACNSCQGKGTIEQCDPSKVVLNANASIFEGAFYKNKALQYYTDRNGQFMATLQEIARQKGWDIEVPWHDLHAEIKDVILFGTGDAIWNVTWEYMTKSRSGSQELKAKWLGLCRYIEEEYERKRNNKNIKHLQEMLHELKCPTCHGSRIKQELLQMKFRGKSIHDLSQMTISDCLAFLSLEEESETDTISKISEVVLPNVKSTLSSLVQIGLDYLSLDRTIRSLSGGEQQRVSLAGQLSSHLFGVTYILDEPTIGLDGAKVTVLVEILKRIIENGNTVVVVEHDPMFIQNADYVIEMGPGAGNAGGNVVFQGDFNEVLKAKYTSTYKMLQSKNEIYKREQPSSNPSFGIKNARANNLKNIDVHFHLHQITGITGVSGSGKSSLIKEVLYRSWDQGKPVNCTSILGMDYFDKVELIDQRMPFQNRLSTPASLTGILSDLSAIFSKSEIAIKLGLKKAYFNYQSKKGKCPSCNGFGKQKTSMDFMSDIWLVCDLCQGMRYNDEVLSCRIEGWNIGEVLQKTTKEVMQWTVDKSLKHKLEILEKVGVGHLLLGQSVNTLSMGEAQRLKLATSLLQKRKEKTLYLFDEPSTGLHYYDIRRLLEMFRSIVDREDTIIFIEHNQTMLQSADRIIKLGPGSGENGGEVIS